jgi:hypothetical protein
MLCDDAREGVSFTEEPDGDLAANSLNLSLRTLLELAPPREAVVV